MDYGPTWKYPGTIGAIVPSNDGQVFIAVYFNVVDGVTTSAIARLNGDIVHRFTSIDALSNGSIHVTLAGRPGYTQIIESSEDLSVWTPVYTNAAAPVTFEFHDVSTSKARRFYPVHSECIWVLRSIFGILKGEVDFDSATAILAT